MTLMVDAFRLALCFAVPSEGEFHLRRIGLTADSEARMFAIRAPAPASTPTRQGIEQMDDDAAMAWPRSDYKRRPYDPA